MTRTFIDTTVFDVTTCSKCGIQFGLTKEHLGRLRESHDEFFCPNGHTLHFPEETKAEKLEKELERVEGSARRYLNWYESEVEDRQYAERRASARKGVITRMKNRLARGECPCCNQKFKNLEDHMRKSHPDFAMPEVE